MSATLKSLNWISSAWNGITNTAKNIASGISNLFSGGAVNTASAANSVPVNVAPTTRTTTLPTMSEGIQNFVAYNPQYGYNGAANPTTQAQVLNNALNSVPAMPKNAPGIVPQVYPGSTGPGTNQNVNINDYGGFTPSTPAWSAPVDSYGRASSRDFGSQSYFDSSGNMITPKWGFSGISGSGTSMSSPMFSPTGAQGANGTPAYTGILQGTGGYGTPSIPGTTPEEEKKKQTEEWIKKNTQGMGSQAGAWSDFYQNLLGGPNLKVTTEQNPFEIPGYSNPINVNQINTGTKGVTQTSYYNSPNDVGQVTADLNAKAKDNLNTVQTQEPFNPNDPSLVNERQNALSYFQGIGAGGDQLNSMMQQLTAYQKQRTDITQQVQAITQTYQGVIDEIKNNPNLPKGLAVKRLEAINTSQKSVLQGHLNALQILNQQIEDSQGNIATMQNQQERNRTYAMNALQLMIQSGAVGGFTTQDMQTFSKALGIPVGVLQSMKDKANRPDTKTTVEKGPNDSLYTVTITTDKSGKTTVSKQQIVAGKPVASESVISGQIVDNSGSPVKLSDTQSQFFSMGMRLSKTANEVQNLLQKIPTNSVKGWVTEKGYLVPVVQGALTPEMQQLMQKMYEMNNTFVYFTSGKQINESEFERLSKQAPNLKATPEYNSSAISNFISLINDRMSNYMKVNGWTVAGGNQGQSSTNSNDPMGLF